MIFPQSYKKKCILNSWNCKDLEKFYSTDSELIKFVPRINEGSIRLCSLLRTGMLFTFQKSYQPYCLLDDIKTCTNIPQTCIEKGTQAISRYHNIIDFGMDYFDLGQKATTQNNIETTEHCIAMDEQENVEQHEEIKLGKNSVVQC